MSDLMRMTGMYSGMDTESIVQQLVSVKQTKVTNLKNEQKKLEWKQTAWQDLNAKIYSLYTKTLSDLRLSGSYKKKKTTCSDTTKVSVTASGSAVNGTQTLKVNKLAKSGYLTGAKLESTKTEELKDENGNPVKDSNGNIIMKPVDWKTTDKVSEIDSDLVGKKISVTVGQGVEAKTKEIEITNDMTINEFVGELKGAGVNASFDEGNQRFFISSTGTGSAKEFTLTDDSGALKSLGLEAGATYANGSTATELQHRMQKSY